MTARRYDRDCTFVWPAAAHRVRLGFTGKNPVVVDPKADVNLVARRVLWGRFSNSGQICTCPEYILVPEEKHKALVDELKTVYVLPCRLSS